MRIVIQDPASKLYLSQSDWNDNVNNAIVFENVAKAEDFCREHHLSDALIVFKFNDGRNDTSFLASSRSTLHLGKKSGIKRFGRP